MLARPATLALATLALSQVAFVPPTFAPRARTRGARVTVVHKGDMFDLINSTDCIAWPSEEAKARGGQSGWGGWSPSDGDQGVAVARTGHCFQTVDVVFVRIGEHWVAIGASGVRFDSGSLADLPVITK
ncbi:MAG: hypothetical protein HYV09_14500 [Deltaproteobacteria bacterium]|nr:hypothetical protein [Deltaproteobacteria bacterium]